LAFGACLFTAVVFGVAPALFALRLDLNKTLKSGGRGATGDRGHQRFRQVLIVGQFALALVLLAGAALFVRGIQEANNRRYGWESDRLVTRQPAPPPPPTRAAGDHGLPAPGPNVSSAARRRVGQLSYSMPSSA
jgi:putative ABC transport system permease protein